MPILAGLLGSLFSGIFEAFAKRLTINLALIASLIASYTAALLAVKAVIFTGGLIAAHTLPPMLVTALGMLLPSNIANIITTVWLGDTIISSWGYWTQRVPILYQLAKA